MFVHAHEGGVHTRSASATEYGDVNYTQPPSLMGETEPAPHVPSPMGNGSLFSGSAESDGGSQPLSPSSMRELLVRWGDMGLP